jgi:hypothetical protein
MTRSCGAGSRATPSGVVVVRLGSDWGLDNDHWLAVFRDITDQLATSGTA